ncbi:MAG: SpoIIE family protein phosphatase [Spirochaetia bacterium]|nr:SpoIIE family protein phosphatase [Spirochaetia bacterium]
MKNIEARDENIKLKRLLDAGSALNSSLDIEHLLPLIIKSARDLLDAEASSLFLLDKKHNYLFCEVAIGEKGKLIKQYLRLEMGDGIAGSVAQSKKPVVIDDAYQDSRFDKSWDKISGFKTKSIICIPIYIKERLIGTLEVMNKKTNTTFDLIDLEILDYLGNIAAVAIDNARLHESLQVKVRELSLLTEMEKKISNGWGFDQLIDWAIARVMEALQARGASVFIFSDDKNFLTLKSSAGFIKSRISENPVIPDKGIVGISLREQRPVLIKNLHADERLHGEPIQSHESSSMVCAPLQSQNEIYGFMIINDKIDGFSFTRDDLNSLNNVAGRISMLLKTTHIFDKIKETDREQESAAKLMEKILPTSIPVIKGLDLHTQYIPYNLVGGDFYRFFEFSENKLGILVVDVSGHGFPAALISVMVNTMISAIPLSIADSPALFFNFLNNNLLNRLGGNFLTGIYLIIDMEKKSVCFANAGHTDLIHYRSKQDEFLSLNVKGPLLGIWKDPMLQQKEFPIESGDRLFVYTDGLFEINRNDNSQIIDESEIPLEIKTHIKKTSPDFLHDLVQTILKKSLKNEFNDDVTMIIVDFK